MNGITCQSLDFKINLVRVFDIFFVECDVYFIICNVMLTSDNMFCRGAGFVSILGKSFFIRKL